MAKKSAVKIRKDAFIAKVVGNPKVPPDCLLFKGFVGDAIGNYVRLYSDPELGDFVDIPQEAILYSQPMTAAESPLGGSYVWIQRDAKLRHGPADDGVVETFLDGPIYRDYLKQVKVAGKSKLNGAVPPGMGVTRFGCPGRFSRSTGSPGKADSVTPGPGPTSACRRRAAKSK